MRLHEFNLILKEEMSDEELQEFFHNNVADQQRGNPETAMLRAQEAMGGGVLSVVIEHTGDLIHRMSERRTFNTGGYEFVKEKVDKILSYLDHGYGFARETNENLRNNARYAEENGRGTKDEYYQKVETSLLNYAKAHSQLSTYNEVQRLANNAAVAIGESNYTMARVYVGKLSEYLEEGVPAWIARAHQIDGDPRIGQ